MRKTKAEIKIFTGESNEIGKQIGKWVTQSGALQHLIIPKEGVAKEAIIKIQTYLAAHNPQLLDELHGFIEETNLSMEQVLFNYTSYLERGCSLVALQASKVTSNQTCIARTYDFNDQLEEMCLSLTKTKNKYAHISSHIHYFGRGDGINEHGLAVCQASNGMPVGNFEGGIQPSVEGVQFWILVRTILENCKNVQEAIALAKATPLSYNINLMLSDKEQHIALFETLDGKQAYRMIEPTDATNYLIATNHTVFKKLIPDEPFRLQNSLIRYQIIEALLESKAQVSMHDLKNLLATPYPNGLCCHYYDDFFGTLRGMIFNSSEAAIEMTFGSPDKNTWRKFNFENIREETIDVIIDAKKADKDFYALSK